MDYGDSNQGAGELSRKWFLFLGGMQAGFGWWIAAYADELGWINFC